MAESHQLRVHVHIAPVHNGNHALVPVLLKGLEFDGLVQDCPLGRLLKQWNKDPHDEVNANQEYCEHRQSLAWFAMGCHVRRQGWLGP